MKRKFHPGSCCVLSVILSLLQPIVSPAFQDDETAGSKAPAAASKSVAAKVQGVSAEQRSGAQLAEASGVKAEWHPLLGTPLSIRGPALGLRRAYSGGHVVRLRQQTCSPPAPLPAETPAS